MRHSPHVDQILGERHCVRIAADGDRAIGVAALAFLAVRDANHGAANLANLGDLGATLADYAADQVVRHGHLLLLRIGLRLLAAILVAGAQLRAGQRCQRCAPKKVD